MALSDSSSEFLMMGGTKGPGVAFLKNGGEDGAIQDRKKCSWSIDEDEVLRCYIREQGEGDWNSVPKKTGLQRSGRSCRLRWMNNLKPGLKKGPFSLEEERIAAELHEKIGAKWSQMVAYLPGRTDNDIKNHWNNKQRKFFHATTSYQRRASMTQPVLGGNVTNELHEVINGASNMPDFTSNLMLLPINANFGNFGHLDAMHQCELQDECACITPWLGDNMLAPFSRMEVLVPELHSIQSLGAVPSADVYTNLVMIPAMPMQELHSSVANTSEQSKQSQECTHPAISSSLHSDQWPANEYPLLASSSSYSRLHSPKKHLQTETTSGSEVFDLAEPIRKKARTGTELAQPSSLVSSVDILHKGGSINDLSPEESECQNFEFDDIFVMDDLLSSVPADSEAYASDHDWLADLMAPLSPPLRHFD